MCGEGCLKIVKRVSLAVPAKDKSGTRFFGACLIERAGSAPMITPNGCAIAFDMAKFLKKTGAKIIEP